MRREPGATSPMKLLIAIPALNEEASIQQIIDYMSNRLCSIATQTVTSAVGSVTNPINGAINGAVGQVNGAIGGAVPGGMPVPVVTTNPVSANTPPSASVWDRMSCMFGRGATCPR